MIVREVRPEEKSQFNRVVTHPLQSWEWGEFRQKTGQEVARLGLYDGSVLKQAFQVTFHDLPLVSQKVGYFPKGPAPDETHLSALHELAKKHQALFIKLEPNVAVPAENETVHQQLQQFLMENGSEPGKPLFTKYTFQLDLTKPEEELFKNLESKTRYNVNLAHRKGVTIRENSTPEGLAAHLEILAETTSRQGFYAHSPSYFEKMWETLHPSGMMRIFEAVYEEQVLTSWIMFVFNGVLYYPYGASRSIHRNVMASNLMMWEMIKFGQEQGCHLFDMWGSLGPDADKSDPFYGFHRFKRGYGGQLMSFIGTYDLVENQPLYKLFRVGDNLRWTWLRLKAKLPF